MRRLILALALLWPTGAWAQCSGIFPANSVCGNSSASPNVPSALPAAGFTSLYTAPGTGGVTTGIASQFFKFPTLSDWTTATNAYNEVNTATSGGTIFITAGTSPSIPASFYGYAEPNVLWQGMSNKQNFGFFNELGQDGVTNYIFADQHPNPHIGTQWATVAIEGRPVGGGNINPTIDMGLGVSLMKQNFATTTTSGELDALYLVTRNGGPDGGGSDSGGILINNAVVGTAGFAAAMETVTTQLARITFTNSLVVDTQLGVIDTVGGLQYGLVIQPNAGFSMTNGIKIQTQQAGDEITTPFTWIDHNSHQFTVDFAGDVLATGWVNAGSPSSVGLNAGDVKATGGTVYASKFLDNAFSVDTTGNMSAFTITATNTMSAPSLTVGANINTALYKVGGVSGVSCSAGTTSQATLVVTGGIVTHC